jgi:hypothetical protein
MKANELRLGNLLNHNNGSMVGSFIVGLIHLEDIIKKNSHAREYEPIPLTEEWLLKFGFEKSQEQWYTIKYFTDCDLATEQMAITYNLSSNRCAVFDAIEETDIVNILSYPIYTSKKVLYVHELQNIYFALTKKELTMK